jgi:hypothetical protein
MKLFELLALILWVGQVVSYGVVGHELICKLAEQFISKPAAEKIKKLLPHSEKSFHEACTWADRIKHHGSYNWSKKLHYIDTPDNPPLTCFVSFPDGCSKGCSISAMKNTSTILRDPNTSKSLKREALLFYIHIMGDMHQPLHTFGKGKGGNLIDVVFSKKKVNLHHVWDDLLLLKGINSKHKGNKDEHFRYMLNRLVTNYNAILISESCKDKGTMFCPEEWAVETNRLNCGTVLQFEENEDLAFQYFEKNYPVIESLILNGAVRLAETLNQIFE